MMHSNFLQYSQRGGRYDIDTNPGMSGSPVYFMEKVGEREVAHVVGIHKGFDNIARLNICTLITQEMISKLK